MKHATLPTALVLILGALALGTLLSCGSRHGAPDDATSRPLPWHIEPTADGSTRVFGLTLGRSTVGQAAEQLRGAPEISLFVSPAGNYAMEAYFDDVSVAGLGAKFILVVGLAQADLARMYDRGARISTLGNDTRRVSLNSDDYAQVLHAPVDGITYLPKIVLDADQVRRRFGNPAVRIREHDGDRVHWLYPPLGLDVALSDTQAPVLQYVAPSHFDTLMAPLRRQGTVLR